MWLKVDVHPFASGDLCSLNCSYHNRGPQALALVRRVYDRVQEKAMGTSVPHDMHEGHELVSVKPSDPGDSVPPQAFRPWSHAATCLTEGEVVKTRDRKVIGHEVHADLGAVVHLLNVLILGRFDDVLSRDRLATPCPAVRHSPAIRQH